MLSRESSATLMNAITAFLSGKGGKAPVQRALSEIVATEKDPHNGQAWFRLGGSLYRLGRNDESRQAYQQALQNQEVAEGTTFARTGNPRNRF